MSAIDSTAVVDSRDLACDWSDDLVTSTPHQPESFYFNPAASFVIFAFFIYGIENPSQKLYLTDYVRRSL